MIANLEKKRIIQKHEFQSKEKVDDSKTRIKNEKRSERLSEVSGNGEISKDEKNIINAKHLPDIKAVEKEVLQAIVGQDTQVRQIVTAIYRAICFKTIKANVLIVGSSGTGKTETIKQVAKQLNIPYVIEDATKYTKEGYVGSDVEDMVFNLIENADMDLEKAKHGMIIIDEIDKKVSYDKNDISGTEVLKSLLKIMEGIKIPISVFDNSYDVKTVDFDTRNIIIIFLGAFSGIDKIREKRLNTNPLGFYVDNTEERKELKLLKQDLVKYGLPEEFAGRIDTIIEMNKLTRKDLALILKQSKLSIFRRYETELKSCGMTLSYDSKLFDSIAEKSMMLDTGARELSNTVNYIFENIIYDILADPGKYTKCTLDLDIVNDNTKYTLS